MASLNRRAWARSASFIVLSILINLLPTAETASAGQAAASAAGIIGQITDGTGAILPGVTVTATSPALQVPSVTAVTDAQGEYRLSPLPIGIYTVVYELAGFQNLRRENVRLTVGFVAKLDQVLNLGAVSETITVSGAPAAVTYSQEKPAACSFVRIPSRSLVASGESTSGIALPRWTMYCSSSTGM